MVVTAGYHRVDLGRPALGAALWESTVSKKSPEGNRLESFPFTVSPLSALVLSRHSILASGASKWAGTVTGNGLVIPA